VLCCGHWSRLRVSSFFRPPTHVSGMLQQAQPSKTCKQHECRRHEHQWTRRSGKGCKQPHHAGHSGNTSQGGTYRPSCRWITRPHRVRHEVIPAIATLRRLRIHDLALRALFHSAKTYLRTHRRNKCFQFVPCGPVACFPTLNSLGGGDFSPHVRATKGWASAPEESLPAI
jgi:hypothetical protein